MLRGVYQISGYPQMLRKKLLELSGRFFAEKRLKQPGKIRRVVEQPVCDRLLLYDAAEKGSREDHMEKGPEFGSPHFGVPHSDPGFKPINPAPARRYTADSMCPSV